MNCHCCMFDCFQVFQFFIHESTQFMDIRLDDIWKTQDASFKGVSVSIKDNLCSFIPGYYDKFAINLRMYPWRQAATDDDNFRFIKLFNFANEFHQFIWLNLRSAGTV